MVTESLEQRATRGAPKFPAVTFSSKLDFDNYLSKARATLDATFLHERQFATSDAQIILQGTCAPCMRPTTFTARLEGGERLPDGTAVPNWREAFVCDCRDRLNARLRATLHFLIGVTGVTARTRLVELGPPTQLATRLESMLQVVSRQHSLVSENGSYRLPIPTGSAEVVLAAEALHLMPPLEDTLTEVRRVLAPGGQFVFTVPFRAFSAQTVTRPEIMPLVDGRPAPIAVHEVHEMGWDLTVKLREAGFRRPLAHAYRSEELGYYGLFNMIFSADT